MIVRQNERAVRIVQLIGSVPRNSRHSVHYLELALLNLYDPLVSLICDQDFVGSCDVGGVDGGVEEVGTRPGFAALSVFTDFG